MKKISILMALIFMVACLGGCSNQQLLQGMQSTTQKAKDRGGVSFSYNIRMDKYNNPDEYGVIAGKMEITSLFGEDMQIASEYSRWQTVERREINHLYLPGTREEKYKIIETKSEQQSGSCYWVNNSVYKSATADKKTNTKKMPAVWETSAIKGYIDTTKLPAGIYNISTQEKQDIKTISFNIENGSDLCKTIRYYLEHYLLESVFLMDNIQVTMEFEGANILKSAKIQFDGQHKLTMRMVTVEINNFYYGTPGALALPTDLATYTAVS